MPKVSPVPGSPQSSASTVNGSVVVPVDRITAAVPVNVACLLPGVAGQEVPGLLMNSPLKVAAFMRTPAGLSLYSRFPVGVPPPSSCFTTKPKLACDLGSAKLGTRAGRDRSTPSTAKTGSPWIWPPPLTFPGVEGTPPTHAPLGAGEMSQGVKSASPTTSSPVPVGLLVALNGPLGEPHQLHSAFTVFTWLPASTSSPSPTKLAEPTVPMLFSLITTPELGPPTNPKKLSLMAWPAPIGRSLFMMLRLLLLSKTRMAALKALVLLVMLLS